MASQSKPKKKTSVSYICRNCDAHHIRWAGKCNFCDSWNNIEELSPEESLETSDLFPELSLSRLSELNINQEEQRFSSGIKDFDQVLGGGIVSDSLILLGGEPGVGKSTLMLEMTRHSQLQVYYFSGEESVQQVGHRAHRMGIDNNNLFISRETNLERICASITKNKPQVSVIDSIQTMHCPDRPGSPGSVGHLRDAAMLLLESARTAGGCICMTGHVTKDGAVAGPRLLEHMVDVVLYFESDRTNHYRILRAVKNRFGPVGEVAIFQMVPKGLQTVSSLPLLASRGKISGSVHSLILGGSRPLPVEVQALVTSASGPAKRMTEGLDNRRLLLLAAVLEKYCKELGLASCDIFTNLASGFSSNEPGLDLGQCVAILSSALELLIPADVACLGEVGLGGEVRPVERLSLRIKELYNLGFRTILVPKDNAITEPLPVNMQTIALSHVRELLQTLRKLGKSV